MQMFFKIGGVIFLNIHRKTSVLESFLIKLQALQRETLFKRVFKKGVFLRILRKLYRHFFYRTPQVADVVSLIKQLFSIGDFTLGGISALR